MIVPSGSSYDFYSSLSGSGEPRTCSKSMATQHIFSFMSLANSNMLLSIGTPLYFKF